MYAVNNRVANGLRVLVRGELLDDMTILPTKLRRNRLHSVEVLGGTCLRVLPVHTCAIQALLRVSKGTVFGIESCHP